MQDALDKIKKIGEAVDLEDLVDFSNDDFAIPVLRDASSEGSATKAGEQMQSLQSAMDSYANIMNRAAIAKSTNQPVKTPSQQFKGFIAEEHHKVTLKINALAEGKPDYKVGAYTNGLLPDGSTLSAIDESVDISIWGRRVPWGKPMRIVDYQSKMHNDASRYIKDMQIPKYQSEGLEFVGGSGQGVNDTISVKIGNKVIHSDPISNQEAVIKADLAKAQATPDYSKRQEKINELNNTNIKMSIEIGMLTGAIFAVTKDVFELIKNSENLTEEQFIQIAKDLIVGALDGGARGGAISCSVKVLGKITGKEIMATSLEAVPAMSIANVSVDIAKDFYKCFVEKTIDADDLLCNSVNNVYSSAIKFSGGFAIGKIGSKIVEHASRQSLAQSANMLEAAKISAETGAAIGSPLGPIGAIIGSVIGSVVVGLGANAVIGIAKEDAERAYFECIEEINAQIELSGIEKYYYFADSMESISDFRLSYKTLLPCYNLISDLAEYNIHKKAMKSIAVQMQSKLQEMDAAAIDVLQSIERKHRERMDELVDIFAEQEATLTRDFQDALNSYIAYSYTQYIDLFIALNYELNMLDQALEKRIEQHSYILNYMRYRNTVNKEINNIIKELMNDVTDNELLIPFLERVTSFISQDELLVGRQFISFEEAVNVVSREGLL